MNRIFTYFLLELIMAFILIIPVHGYAQTAEEMACQNGSNTVSLQIEASIPSLTPSGNITYCSAYSGEFKVSVSLRGLRPNHPYILCLNGKENGRGNDILMRKESYGREGVYNFGSFETDNNGSKTGLFKISDLPPSTYDIKFLIKDMKSWSVPLKNDFVLFNIIAPLPTTLVIPEKVKMKQLVKGNLSDPQKYVYICIHPLSTELWWVQNLPAAINKDGSWYTMCYFGTKTMGIGDSYEVVAIISSKHNLFKAGDQISVDKMRNMLKDSSHSEIKLVERPE